MECSEGCKVQPSVAQLHRNAGLCCFVFTPLRWKQMPGRMEGTARALQPGNSWVSEMQHVSWWIGKIMRDTVHALKMWNITQKISTKIAGVAGIAGHWYLSSILPAHFWWVARSHWRPPKAVTSLARSQCLAGRTCRPWSEGSFKVGPPCKNSGLWYLYITLNDGSWGV